MKTLTSRKLRKLTFQMSMHLNRGKFHDTVKRNEEYKLSLMSSVQMKGYKTVAYELQADVLRGEDPLNSCNLMEKDHQREMTRWIRLYNAAVRAKA